MGDQKFNYGGQAVIEGVMMRGSSNIAVAVRNPAGQIVIKEEPITSALYNGVWSKIPFVRGLGLLWDSLGLGMRALMFSADIALEEEEPTTVKPWEKRRGDNDMPADTVVSADPDASGAFSGPLAWGTVAFSLAFSIALFFLTPAAVVDGIHLLTGYDSTLGESLIEGVIRLLLVVAYIYVIGYMDDIKRLFAYHGAEHKTINAYEDGAPLTPEIVARYPLEHPRCGTGFLLVVVFISVLLFSVVSVVFFNYFGERPPILVKLASRVILVPVVAGIAYEYIRLLAKHTDKLLGRILVAPQLWLQKLTTREPSHDMLLVSITALEYVLAAEQLLDTIDETGRSFAPVSHK